MEQKHAAASLEALPRFLTYGQKHGQESCLITAEVLFCGIKKMNDGGGGPRRRAGLARVYDERILRCYHPGGVASIACVHA